MIFYEIDWIFYEQFLCDLFLKSLHYNIKNENEKKRKRKKEKEKEKRKRKRTYYFINKIIMKGSSPTIYDTYRHFSIVKNKLGLNNKSSFYLLLIFYPIVTFLLLLYIKPDMICEKKIFDNIDLDERMNDRNNRYTLKIKRKISFTKLLSIFLLLQFPLLLYLILK